MSRYLLTLLLSIGIFNIGYTQEPPLRNAANGGVFTPKGTLKALIVFVTYKDQNKANPAFKNTEQSFSDWKVTTDNQLPDFVNPVTGDCPSYIFNRESHFETHLDQVEHNFSKTFYLMSNQQFKLIGEVFKDAKGRPTVVEIDPTGGYSWTQMNQRAVAAMAEINPDFDFGSFDQRKNNPNFAFDNSDTAQHKADGILDFVVFVHRYNQQWQQAPTKGMAAWVGSGGGFAGTGISAKQAVGRYRISEGFTMTYNSGVFVHEVAHVLFNAPHIMGVNNVIGDYFDLQSAGWGIMAPISLFAGFNAWERWYCGFIEPITIRNEADLEQQNSFVLRDYFTTGDAARIAIPFSGGQYLWLENHQKLHPQDEHPWAGKDLGHGDILAPSAAGVYAYVEAIASSRTEIFSPLSPKANGLHVLHAGGNYDYQIREDQPIFKNAWGNPIRSFSRKAANPIAGTNNLYRFTFDENQDGVIGLDPNYNSSRTEYKAPIIREEIAPDSFVNLYGGFGVYDEQKAAGYIDAAAFEVGDYLDISTNPMPLNYPRYNRKTAQQDPYYLNGLGIKLEAATEPNAIKVTVRYDQIKLCQDRRWCGNIILPNITEDEGVDLEIAACTKLTLNKSGIPNTHIQTEKQDFVHQTVLLVQAGATLKIAANSQLVLEDDSELIIEEGAKIIIGKKAKLIIGKQAKFSASKSSIDRKQQSKIIQR